MHEEKERIIEHARDRFFREGFLKTTMDEIAAELHISKKTIYKHFDSKNELVFEITERFRAALLLRIKNHFESDKSPIEKFFGLYEQILQISQTVSERFFKDIRIGMPGMWDKIEESRSEMINTHLARVIRQGVEQGLMKDYHPLVVHNVYLKAIQGTVHPDFLIQSNLSIGEVASTTLSILMEGMMTDKGRKQFQKLMARRNK